MSGSQNQRFGSFTTPQRKASGFLRRIVDNGQPSATARSHPGAMISRRRSWETLVPRAAATA